MAAITSHGNNLCKTLGCSISGPRGLTMFKLHNLL